MHAECTGRLTELRSTLEASIRHRDRTLSKVANDLWFWFTLVRREKATYHAMNMFSIDVTRKCLVAEGWCPTSAKSRVAEAVVVANRKLVGVSRNDLRVYLAQRSNAANILPHDKMDERVSRNRRGVRGCEVSRSEPDGDDYRDVSVSVRGYVWRFWPRYYYARICYLHGH